MIEKCREWQKLVEWSGVILTHYMTLYNLYWMHINKIGVDHCRKKTQNVDH
jgi:hypothetical protein